MHLEWKFLDEIMQYENDACSKNIFQILANRGIEDWEKEFSKKTFGEKKIILQFPTLDFYHKSNSFSTVQNHNQTG